MALPKDLEEALDNAPKYNPSMVSGPPPKLNLNRARRRMLDSTPDDGEITDRATDRHSVEARMMNDLLGDMGMPRKKAAAVGGRRRSKEGGFGEQKVDSDDESVGSVQSTQSSASVGGKNRRKISPRPRNTNTNSNNNNPNSDLMTQMAGRLARVEMTMKRLKDEGEKKDKMLSKQRKKIRALEEAVASAKAEETASALTGLADENDNLRAQISDMEKFLSDYGLVWVGNNENSKNLKPSKKAGQQKKEEEEQLVEESKHEESKEDINVKEDKEVAELKFDRDIFCQRIRELNSMINADKAKVVRDGNNAKLEYQNGIDIGLFSDGIIVGRQKVRKWDSETCVKFVADVMDGFFPAEFKNSHPNGVKLDLKDCRECHSGDYTSKAFKGEGNSLVYGSAGKKVNKLTDIGGDAFMPMKASEFLEKLPEKVVGVGGGIIDIRSDIKERIEGVNEVGVGEGNVFEEGDAGEAGEKEEEMKRKKKEAMAKAAERRLRKVEKDEQEEKVGEEQQEQQEEETVLVQTPALQKLNNSMRLQHLRNTGKLKDMEEEEEVEEEEKPPKISTLRVKLPIGDGKTKTLVIKMSYTDKISDLIEEIDREKVSPGKFEIRTAFPNKAYNEGGESLEEAGLVPNASLMVKYLK
ncbi:hypothetical protein TrLO_g5689 [Triparma laevis f. longispina]|uniref:UBX domain-containing protein n=1 Tax=Triparma laevis f. longispina TaxID=1714387 RepID=A0A9W6ZEQ3_9STRA|nr:hypothetical protein TrLO_g5689 [Triparma laevis f. longispina]